MAFGLALLLLSPYKRIGGIMQHSRAREIALKLGSFESITDGEGEERFGPFLAEYLRSLPAFNGAEGLIKLEPTLDDPHNRSVVYALVRGEGRDTVILTGHYDVVGTRAFGVLEPWAFDPETLTPKLLEELRASRDAAEGRGEPFSATEARALRDLESGDFLPGRGLLDMKAGLAAGIAVLEDFAAAPHRRGNILFMAVPDEEGASHGMRSALRQLPGITAEWDLSFRLAINLDAAVDQGSGEAGRAVFLGSIGKTHPFVLFLGRPSHAGAPFDGINPSLLAAEFVRRVECAPALLGAGAEGRTEPPPPPTVLYHRDLRRAYDVTSPEAAFTSLNVLSSERSPDQVLRAVETEVRGAMEDAITLLRERAALQSRLEGRRLSLPDRQARIIRWSVLATLARERDAGAYEAARARAESRRASGEDAVPGLAELATTTANIARLEGPAAVIGLAPPYYPRAAFLPGEASLEAIIAEEARRLASEIGESISLRPFFPGISDMSYLSPADTPQARLEASAECPLGIDAPPLGFRCPTINVGPWGREYHQRLERLYAPYAFTILPEFLERLVRRLLG